MEEVKLPKTALDFKTCFKVTSNLELENLLRNPSKRSAVQEKIWKYSGAALAAGRALDSTIICVAGASGAGKSTLINSFFRDNTLCRTNAWKSQTSEIVLVCKTLKVTEEKPPLRTELNFIDLPGYFDTESQKKEAEHHAQLRQFKESRLELAKRTEIPRIFRSCYSIPENVYPNLTLFVVKATDNRIEGENSQFMKSIKLLRDNGGLVDTKKSNLIVVVTRVMELGRKDATINKKFQELKLIISNAVQDTFGLSRVRVHVIPIENEPEEYELQERGDFYELPVKDEFGNNELSHYNLYQTMKECLTNNGDFLGRLSIAWYCNTECPDRNVPAQTINTHIPINSRSIEQSMDELKISRVADNPPKLCKFQSLGFGFCPVTEKVMPHSPLKHSSEPTEVEIANSKFLIPAGVNVFGEKMSKSNFLTFFKKEEYENHMHNSYGLEAGITLVVSASSKGKWVEGATGSEQQSWISQVHEIQVATLRLNDPITHPKNVNFQNELDSLPENYSQATAAQFQGFFSKWGSHLIYEQGIGGAVQLNCAMKASQITREKLRDVQNEAKGVFKQLFVGGDHHSGGNSRALRSIGIDAEDLEICGGDPPRLPTLETLNPKELVEWSESVSAEPAELRKSMKLYAYYNLIDGQRSQALRKATEEYLQNTLAARVENEFKQNEMAKNDLKDVVEAPAAASCFPKGTPVFVDGGTSAMVIENLSGPVQLTTVTLHGRGSDRMKIGKFSTTKFCTFLDEKLNDEIDYIALTFTNGKKLLVSEGHMIFQFIPEKQVVIGKQAKHFKIGEIAVYTGSPEHSPIQYPTVTKITKEKHVGAYSPLTMSGTFFANGFLVSSYANVNSFQVAQCALAPLKIWHFTRHLKILSKVKAIDDSDDAVQEINSDGIHPYAKFLIALRKSFTRRVSQK